MEKIGKVFKGCSLNKYIIVFALLIGCLSLFSGIECTSDLEYNSQGIPPALKYVLTDDLRTFQAPRWIQEEYPYYISGFDYYNRPIWILDFGKWDVLKVIKMGGKDFEDFDKYYDQCHYRTMATRIRNLTMPNDMQMNETIRENEAMMIYDMNHYPAAQVSSPQVVSYLRKKLKQLKSCYDYIKVIHVINVSTAGRALINLMRPTIADIYHKAEFYGTNRDQWIPVLQKNYPRDQLPEYYGGAYNHTLVPLPS